MYLKKRPTELMHDSKQLQKCKYIISLKIPFIIKDSFNPKIRKSLRCYAMLRGIYLPSVVYNFVMIAQ